MKCHSLNLQLCVTLIAFSAYKDLSYKNKARSKVFIIQSIALEKLNQAL